MSMANMGLMGTNLTTGAAKISEARTLLLNEGQLDASDAADLMWLADHATDARDALDKFMDDLTHILGMVQGSSGEEGNDLASDARGS